MQLHKNKDIEYLLICYILRCLREFPFIKINKIFDERKGCNTAVISLGYEEYDVESNHTFQTFSKYETFTVEFELENIRKYLSMASNYIGYSYDGSYIRCSLTDNELTVARKYSIHHTMKPERLSDKDLQWYLEENKRTILNLYRFKHPLENSERLTLLGHDELAMVEVVLSCSPSYHIIPDGGETFKNAFKVTKAQIENLDRCIFEVNKIKKNLYTVVYEIVTKTYDYRF